MPTYPISNVTRRVVYTGSAGVGPYAFTFEIIANTDVSVYKNDTLLTLTTDYSVTINANGTGSVTLVSAATGADRITIVGNRAVQRTTDFVTGGDLFANTLNDELDSQTIFVQQVAETTDRSIRAPVTDPTSINMVLPKNTDRANKALVFDANGDPAAGMAIFPGTLTATNYPRVNAGGTAYELRTPATVRADIGADNASNLASGTVADARLPSTMDSKTLTNVSISSGSIAGITDLAIADGGTGASTAANARTNLGLGTIATQNAASVAITGGSIAGITDLAIADGGTGASTASDARTNLGLGSIATQSSASVSITGGSVTDITDLAVADGGTGASTAADARTNLGLGTIATQSAASVSITGGSIAGITDLAVADGGTGASTATDARVNLLPSYTSNGGKVLALNVGATDVEWITVSTGGGGGSGDVVGPASATDNAVVRFDGTTGKVVQNSAVTIADTTGNIIGGSYNRVTITAPATGSTMTIADGKTLTANNSITLSGTDATTMTFPSTSATIARTDAGQTFTGTQTTLVAATQDAVAIAGRAGGTSSYVATITPTTLSASRTITLPDNSGTVLTTGETVTVGQGGTGQTSYTDGQLLIGNSTGNTLTKAALTAGSGISITNGAGSITIATSASGSSAFIGTSVSAASDTQTFNASGTWTKPGSGTYALVRCWGGGGSGGRNVSQSGGGGGGGAFTERLFLLSSLGSTVSVTVGAGGVARTVSSAGAAGGATDFGTLLYAYGGGGGGGAGTQSGGGGGGGGSVGSVGNSLGGAGGSELASSNIGVWLDPTDRIIAGASYQVNSTAPTSAFINIPVQTTLNSSGARGGDQQNCGAGPGDSSVYGGGGGGPAVGGAGGSSVWGGGGGGTDGTAGGTSTFGGAGGSSGLSGTQPGGGGAGRSTTTGAGGAGRVIVYVF